MTAFTLAYLLRILHSSDPPLYANLAFDAIQRALPAMQECNFDPELYEEFLAPLLELVRAFAPEDPGAESVTEWSLIQALQDAERSNCIVVVSRPGWTRRKTDDVGSAAHHVFLSAHTPGAIRAVPPPSLDVRAPHRG